MKYLPRFYLLLILLGIYSIFIWWSDYKAFAAISVQVCHATGASSNPYITTTISVNSAADCADATGHDSHVNDIIPIFTYETCTYPGKNWTSENQAIWNNSCNLVP